MNIFRSNPNRTSSQANQAPSGWDSLQSAESFDPSASEQNQSHLAQYQARVINAILEKPQDFTQNGVNISPEDRTNAMQKLTSELNYRKSRQDESNIIQALADAPAETNPDQTFANIHQNEHQMKLLSTWGGAGSENFANMNTNAVRNFITQYPTPLEFENEASDFLDIIAMQDGPTEAEQYEKDMGDFKRNIYGQRLDYYNAYEALHREAETQAQARGTAQSIAHQKAEAQALLERQRQDAAEIAQTYYDNAVNNPYAAPEMQGQIISSDAKPPKKGIFNRFFGRKK